jgi:tetratricopeptide (TPR) repeat protein
MKSMRHSPPAAVLLVAAMLMTNSWPRGVQAAPVRTERAAKTHFAEGQKLFAEGRYEEALAEFEAGYAAVPLPGFLIDIGQCQRKLGNTAEAREAYDSFLDKAPDSPVAPEVRRFIRELPQRPSYDERTRDEPASTAEVAPPPSSVAPPARPAPAVEAPPAPAAVPPSLLFPLVPEAPKSAVTTPLVATPAPAPEESARLPSESSKLWWVLGVASIAGVAAAIVIGASGTMTTTIHDGTLGTLRR